MYTKKIITIVLMMTASLFISCQSSKDKKENETTKAKRPNIIVIMTDDIGYSDLGCYGSEINTPNLDKLAANGIQFTNFYNTSRCSPSRASLLTGLYSHQANMGHLATKQKMYWDEPGYVNNLNKDAATIAEVLKEAGYATYMAGKWHVLGLDYKWSLEKMAEDQSNWPLQRGFDRYFGNLGGSGSYYDTYTLVEDNAFVPPGENFYLTHAITDHTVKYIKEHPADKPFFAYVAYFAAHWPLHAPEEEIAKYKGKYDIGWDSLRVRRFNKQKELGIVNENHQLSEKLPSIIDWQDEPMKAWQARSMETYAAMVDIMDQGIGKIIAALEEKGELDNTIILYMQDNGGCAEPVYTDKMVEPLTEKQKELKPFPYDELLRKYKPKYTREGKFIRAGRGVMAGPPDTWIGYNEEWANLSNTPYRYYKSLVYEGGIITPLIAHWPAGIEQKGVLNNQVGHLIDIMPTCLEIAGVDYPKEFNGKAVIPLEGRSLVPAFQNKPVDRDFLFWEHEASRALRIGDWKLVAKPEVAMKITAEEMNSWELYNLKEDPSEINNIAAEYPEKVREMAEKWQSEASRVQALPWPWDDSKQ
ncbi:MAG: arylsulfatase [Flavobacteriaceae bacterium]|nr:arylsulfatase [Flavobacteriaceae bacterium]